MDETASKKILSMLGLARRAGKTVCGADLAVMAVRSDKTFIVLLARDASERTKKQLSDKCFSHNVKLIHLTASQDEMAKAAGKSSPVSAVAVTDRHFADGIAALAGEQSN